MRVILLQIAKVFDTIAARKCERAHIISHPDFENVNSNPKNEETII